MSTTETDTGPNIEQQTRYSALRDPEDREPETIERELDATRADMRATLEALERRFSFDRLVDMTIGRVRERGGEFAGNLTNAATQNPMPLLLTAIGLSWMMLTSRRGTRSYADYESDDSTGIRDRMGNLRDRAAHASDKMHGAVDSTRDTLRQAAESSREAFRSATGSSREALRSAAHSSRETFEHAAASVQNTAASLRSGATRAAEVTREQAEHARERVDRLLHEQPLMLGALGLAAGAIIGALLPTTEREDRLLGEMRNKAVKNVAEKSRAQFESIRETVTDKLSSADDHEEEERVSSEGERTSSERQTSRTH